MKNSKIVLFLAAFAFVVGITGCEVESEKHEHTFSKEWTSDAIAHWHAATCEHKTEISGIAVHTFGEWKVTKEASEKQGGEKKRICSVCEYVDIAKLEHVHTFGEWAVTKKATEREEGEKERTCSVCKYVESFIIPSLEHTHDFSEDWANNAINHWHIATCEHTTEVSCLAEHSFGGWIVTKVATETSCGEKYRTCSICNYEDKRSTSNILGALVRVKGKEILGTETWIPESKVFTKNRKGIISDLYVIDHEITRNEYRKVMGDSKSFSGDVIDADGNKLSKDDDKFFDAPANNVGWFEAILFCNTLSKKEGLKPCYTINDSTEPDKWGEIPTSKYNSGSTNYELWNKCVCVFNADGYRLPTDVEWEYLARGGQAYEYSGSDKINDVGWYSDNSKVDGNYCYIRIVKTKSPNGYGLYDMSGNVSELCWDLYRDDFIGVENISYQPPIYGIGNSHEARVLRGGNYDEKVDKCLVNYRAFVDFPVVNETAKGKRVGFRVVRTVTE